MLYFSVCSAQFKKCYVLLDDLSNLPRGDEASWEYVEREVCQKLNWTLVSLHSKLEQDFVGHALLHNFEHINDKYAYIGKEYFNKKSLPTHL